jgi:hypothetical protein
VGIRSCGKKNKNPKYYTGNHVHKNNTTIVLISGEASTVLPQYLKQRMEGYRLSKRFEAFSDPFRYKTIVEIYTKQFNFCFLILSLIEYDESTSK